MLPWRRVRSGHADPDHVFLAQRVHGDCSGERRVDAAAESQHNLLEAALAHVIARAKNERRIRAGLDAFVAIMNVALQGLGIEADHVLFERLGLRDDLAVGAEREAGAVEDQAVVAANLVHHGDRHAVMLRDRRQHVLPKFALAQIEGRRRDVQQNLPAGSNQVLHRIDAIQAAVPEVLVIPSVLANGERAREYRQR